MKPVDAAAVHERIAELRARLDEMPHHVRLVAVTKRFPVDRVEAAFAAGADAVGENYAQELIAKQDELDRRSGASMRDGSFAEGDRGAESVPGSSHPLGEERVDNDGAKGRPESIRAGSWHLIGAVQRNKIRKLVGRVAVWETIDRIELLDELRKREAGGQVLLQVNASGETQKNGVEPGAIPELVDHGRRIGLDVTGLMTVGVAGDLDRTRRSFDITRGLVDELGLAECSMGMTADLDLALEAGTTMVRVGSGIFGDRPPLG